MADKLRILFMGSPEFASRSLEQLISDGFNVVGVITGPDRKKGRGQALAQSAVKQTALKNDLPVFQPTNLKDENFQQTIAALNPDLGVVVAFRMLPEKVWNMPRLGTINLHASLLPDYRGAAPINWAIINGEKETGLTTFFLKHEIDTGDVILRKSQTISDDMNAGQLHDILMEKGARLLSDSVALIEGGDYSTIDQQELNADKTLNKAPKIFKNDCRIDWNRDAQSLFNFIRGLSPYPGAWSTLTKNDKEAIFKVYSSQVSDKKSSGCEGKILKNDNHGFMVGTKDFYLKLLTIQVEGKKRMKTEDFLKGFSLENTSIK